MTIIRKMNRQASGRSRGARMGRAGLFAAAACLAGGLYPLRAAEPPPQGSKGGAETATPGATASDFGPAPAFNLQDLRGAMVESAYLSRPVTVVHFWATWCVPCMREIPQLNQFAATYEEQGAALYAIAVSSGTVGELRQVARTYDIRHRVLVGDEAVWRGFGPIESYPMTFIVDNRGRILERYTGNTPEVRRKIEGAVRGLLAASARPRPGP